MLVIGLTGGIGTGKSEVSHILQELGAVVIDADRVGHEAYKPRSEIWRAVVHSFGEEILGPSGEIDRKKLGNIIFRDQSARETLNSIMHPKMADIIGEQIDHYRQEGNEVVVVEAALLMEAGWSSLVDEIWVTSSSEEEIVQRLRDRDGLSEEQIRDRIRSRLPFEERATQAHVVVENSGDKGELREKVESLWSSGVKGKVR